MGNGPLFSSSFLHFPHFFILCALAPLHLCVFSSLVFSSLVFSCRVFLLGFFFFAATSGATTGAWNFWCIIGSLRCPY